MSVRFRIRTQQGQEVSFASQAVFEEFVRSGDLAPEDLVYDGETNEWAPARTHPLVLEVQYESEEEAEAAGGRREPTADDEAAATGEERTGEDERATVADEAPNAADLGLDLANPLPAPTPKEGWSEDVDLVEAGALEGLDDLGLDLAPPSEGRSPEEESEAFVRKMRSERAMDLDAGSGGGLGIRMEDSGSLADMIAKPDSPTTSHRPPPVEKAEPRPRAGAPRSRARRPPGSDAPSTPDRPGPRGAKSTRSRRAEPPKTTASGALKVAVTLVIAAVLGVAGYLAMGLLEERAVADPVDPGDNASLETPDPPPPPPVIASTPEVVSARAQELFLTATQTLVRDLEPIPDAWLSGQYFALPSEYDRLRAVWQRYLDVVRSVRASEVGRYRAAYGRALDDAGVRGDARATRLQAAMDAFATSTAGRNAHWDRVESLAVAAIQSHNALVEAEGLVIHDPAGATGRPPGIGAGVTGRNSETQLLLTQIIDLVEGRLSADGLGPREGANVREWVWGGFLDSVAH